MSDNNININIRAKDKTQGAFKGVMSGLKRVGGAIAAYLSVRAVAGFIKSSVEAFMEGQAAAEALSSALKKNGDDVAALMPKYQEFASAIQSVTTLEDDSIISLMAYGRNLGISSDKLIDATKAAIGFSRSLKVDMNTAMMMVHRSSKGQTSQLAKYGLAVKDSWSKQKKFDFVLKEGAKGMQLAADEAQTMAGRLQQLNNSYGDMKENIGGAIAQGFDLTKVFDDLSLSIQAANESGNFKAWTEDIAALKQGLEPVAELFAGIKDTIKGIGGFLGGAVEATAQDFKALKRGDFKDAFTVDEEEKAMMTGGWQGAFQESADRRVKKDQALNILRSSRTATLNELTGTATLDDVVKAVESLKTKD